PAVTCAGFSVTPWQSMAGGGPEIVLAANVSSASVPLALIVIGAAPAQAIVQAADQFGFRGLVASIPWHFRPPDGVTVKPKSGRSPVFVATQPRLTTCVSGSTFGRQAIPSFGPAAGVTGCENAIPNGSS